MPTGYTADIKDGISFKTYAMNCARAFGACLTLREEPLGAGIPESFEPGDYHRKAAQEIRGELVVLDLMTPAGWQRAADQAWDAAEMSRLMHMEDERKLREAYEAMLVKVKAWMPPTPDHDGLRDFMRTQIEQSIKFDCHADSYSAPTVRLHGEAWMIDRRTRLTRDLQYHEREHALAVERAAKSTAWVRALRDSLP